MDEKEKDFEATEEASERDAEYDENLDLVEVDDEDVIVITDEEGVEHEAIVLDIFPVNGKEYMALFFTDTEEGEIEFYEYAETENEDEAELTEIESDEEFNAVAEAFDKLLEEDEHDHAHEHDEVE